MCVNFDTLFGGGARKVEGRVGICIAVELSSCLDTQLCNRYILISNIELSLFILVVI